MLASTLLDQPDSGTRKRGPKTCPDRQQFDCTCETRPESLAASADVTGAANGWQETCVDRSHRREAECRTPVGPEQASELLFLALVVTIVTSKKVFRQEADSTVWHVDGAGRGSEAQESSLRIEDSLLEASTP